jgi:protein tyrosine/serine phosphatase
LSKRTLFLPVVALGAASLALNYFTANKLTSPNSAGITSRKRLSILKRKKTSAKISRYLLKILNNLDNNRLIFIEIGARNRRVRDVLLTQLEALKSDEPVDDLWIADFYKQRFSRDDTIALANKKAIFYLSNLEEVDKVRISARNTVAKLIGNSLSKLSTKYPSMERYFFEPMLDIYAPLKETEELSNFGIVAENQLYRGGMPVGELTYDQLVDLGIKTVINLKIEDSAVEYVAEQNQLLKRDINLHYLPLPNVAPPTMLQIMEFLTIVYNTEMKPVFIHCHRGADRTGNMAAVFRVTQGYSASWSLLEAEKYNIASSFHNYKIESVYQFEKQWLKWKEQGKIPADLTNFDFISLMAQEQGLEEEN